MAVQQSFSKDAMFHSNTFFKLRLVCFGLPPAAASGEAAAGVTEKKTILRL